MLITILSSRATTDYLPLLIRPPPTSTLFSYTTLFRSHGYQSNCEHGGGFGNGDIDGGQGEKVRAPFADASLVKVPGERGRSEEHTSELQSHSDLVCRLLLEKKKKKQKE